MATDEPLPSGGVDGRVSDVVDAKSGNEKAIPRSRSKWNNHCCKCMHTNLYLTERERCPLIDRICDW